jgi:cell division septum initiation protein DivIVA
MSEKDLLQRIEDLRQKLNTFAFAKSFVDQELVNLSQRLDELLNQYHAMGGSGV